MKMMITGGAGFIGSNFVRYMVNKYPEHDFVNYDKLTYAGNLENLKDMAGRKNYEFIKGDVCDLNLLKEVLKDVDCVFHFAAESHVDNSIGNSLVFTESNTYGTHSLLEAVRATEVEKVIHVSTDEVYGDIEKGSFKEDDKMYPNNPYSASKAAAEMIVRSYYKTYKLPVVITRGNNTIGPYQYPEKIVPRFVTNLMRGKKVPLHGDGSNVRTYIHVDDVCRAEDLLFQKGKPGEAYNIGTDYEVSNLELTKLILQKMEKDDSWIELVKDRPFNDKRYSINTDKIRALGWEPQISFEDALESTVQWYKDNEKWWKDLIVE